jgi:hypothetical protein
VWALARRAGSDNGDAPAESVNYFSHKPVALVSGSLAVEAATHDFGATPIVFNNEVREPQIHRYVHYCPSCILRTRFDPSAV